MDRGWPLVDLLEQAEVAQDRGRASQHRNRKAQVEADLQHAARYFELFLGRLIGAGDDQIYGQPAEGLVQQLGGVHLDLDHVRETVWVVIRGNSVFPCNTSTARHNQQTRLALTVLSLRLTVASRCGLAPRALDPCGRFRIQRPTGPDRRIDR